MSLTAVTLGNVVKKLYIFKMKSYMGLFTSLVILQLLALLFSLSGVGSSGGSINGNYVSVTYYSADMVIAFTLLWSFISAIMITTKAYREDDFIFVTNRFISNLANIAFLITASLIGAITALLSSFLLKVVIYYFVQVEPAINSSMVYSPMEFILGMVTTFGYIFLFSAVGYLIGSFVQFHKLFMFLIPVLLIGFIVPVSRNGFNILIYAGEFYFQEPSFFLTIMKVVGTVGILFSASILLLNQREVRK
ncbi:hypothetical protein SAMN05216389_104153 [Oceanobacillus limi]|uniref:ABC-2 family transporter protein n=1 Tax=Oceanobacillus limi TaxID=930131 RepID=A0A1I0B2L1_9BACI|nr:hypothetical protein [Oceanobacillus limi]SET00951.1 hypothetical protein SAMN05216389_104153 [Oceanobacillus limi]